MADIVTGVALIRYGIENELLILESSTSKVPVSQVIVISLLMEDAIMDCCSLIN